MDAAVAEWGDIAAAAKAEGTSLGPAWKIFIKTKFFVSFVRSPVDEDPKNFLLHMQRDFDVGAATLVISEVRERLDPELGDGIILLSGTDIVCRIEDHGRIEVLLNGESYLISKKRVEWLRSGIKMTKERIAIRQRLAAAAPAAPMPVLRVAAEGDPDSVMPGEVAPTLAERALPVWQAMSESPAFKPIFAVTILVLVAGTVFLTSSKDDEAPPPPPVAQQAAPVQPPPQPMPQQAAPVSNASTVIFRPADNSFSVNAPGMVEEVELTPDQVARLGESRMHQYRLVTDGMTYEMESTDSLSAAPMDRTADLNSMQGVVVGNDGSLIRATPIPLRGATGREVRVSLPGGGERAARYVYIGSKFCMVMVTARDGRGSAAQIDAYLNSFQLN